MPTERYAEIDILNRVMWLLEEGSVRHAVAHDEAFAAFIEELYVRVDRQADALRAA